MLVAFDAYSRDVEPVCADIVGKPGCEDLDMGRHDQCRSLANIASVLRPEL